MKPALGLIARRNRTPVAAIGNKRYRAHKTLWMSTGFVPLKFLGAPPHFPLVTRECSTIVRKRRAPCVELRKISNSIPNGNVLIRFTLWLRKPKAPAVVSSHEEYSVTKLGHAEVSGTKNSNVDMITHSLEQATNAYYELHVAQSNDVLDKKP